MKRSEFIGWLKRYVELMAPHQGPFYDTAFRQQIEMELKIMLENEDGSPKT